MHICIDNILDIYDYCLYYTDQKSILMCISCSKFLIKQMENNYPNKYTSMQIECEYIVSKLYINSINDYNKALFQNCKLLKYIANQTDAICLATVNNSGNALQYVKKQTSEICLAAVNNNGHALQYVKKQTPKICLATVNDNDRALIYI